jgi:cytidylate kinase
LFFTEVRQAIIIAIDGYSSCGKSTLAADLAGALHYVHVDSGAMYRAVTLHFIRHGVHPEDLEAVQTTLPEIRVSFQYREGEQYTLLNDEDVEGRIREHDINQLVSPVAAIPIVRRFLVAQQRQLGAEGGIVMEGRDIGTVVFPDAELKIFLTASTEVRVERRYLDLVARGISATREQVAASMANRDHIDTTRADSPLRLADDAVIIDNTDLSRADQLDRAFALAQDAIARNLRSSKPR